MATITPAITISSTPGLQVTTSVPAMSYNGFINSLGPNVFDIDELFYGSQSLAQFSNPVVYTNYDNFGKKDGETITTPVNPNQYQATQFIPLKAKGIMFNGQNFLQLTLLAGNQLQFIFYGKQINISNDLNKNGDIDNFKTVERALGKPGFFDDDEEKKPDDLHINFVDDETGKIDAPGTINSTNLPRPQGKIRKQTFLLNVNNNTSGNIPVILMQQDNPGNNITNATTRYAWDITGISYSNPSVTLPTYPVGSTGAFTMLTGSLQAANAQGLINVLNSFNSGIFWLETVGPNTFVVTWNDNVVYGDLTVGVPSTTVAWSDTFITSPSIFTLNVNAVNVVFTATPPAQSGSFSVVDGDSVDGGMFAGAAPPHTVLVTRTLKAPPFTVQVIFTGTAIGAVAIPPFIIDTNYTYNVSGS